jgi:hypothetical protein
MSVEGRHEAVSSFGEGAFTLEMWVLARASSCKGGKSSLGRDCGVVGKQREAEGRVLVLAC